MGLEQNKQVALESLCVLGTGDSTVANRIIATDFINREADDPERRWLTGAFADLKFDHDEIVAEGETVIVMATMTGSHVGAFHGIPPTHKPFQQRQVHLFRMRAGQIIEHLALRDDLGLLRQLGVLPS